MRVFNPSITPVTVDSSGHVIAGNGYATVDPTDPVTAEVLAQGLIVEVS